MKTLTKEEAIKKINSFGKIAKVLTTIGIVIAAVVGIVTIITTAFINCVPDDLINFTVHGGIETAINTTLVEPAPTDDELTMVTDMINNGKLQAGVNLGGISIALNNAYSENGVIYANSDMESNTIALKSITGLLVAFIITSIFLVVSLVFGRKLCKSFEVCQSPFDEGVISSLRKFAFSLIPWAVVESIPNAIANKIFSSGVYVFDLNMDVILMVLIILALSVIFKYGAILQQESDETL